ncbi:PilW family protein [Candidatus Uabimicrobium sp. HlEnr_7]|uniref:PilW family protein n=1 Tax=Candidatus Uabimicrobium helgolandensis TaxID=3095367 RepID=UPI0035592589
MRNKQNHGFTLIELMIAVALLSVFTLMLVKVLSQSVSVWRTTEKRREILEASRNIMEIITEDLNAMFLSKSITTTGLLLDYDSNGKQRLRFIRKISQENTHPILRYAGTEKSSKLDYYNLKADKTKKLLAPGGLAEVMYCFVPQQDGLMGLYRGIQAPIDGKNSFFRDKNIDSPQKIREKCHLLGSGILNMEIKCWTATTFTWNLKKLPQRKQKGGPSLIWDSTKRRLTDFFLFRTGNPLKHAKPLKMNVTVVLQNGEPKELLSDLSETDTTAYLTNTQGMAGNLRYMLVDNEWITYENLQKSEVLDLQRGVWNSKAAIHNRFKIVKQIYYEKWDSQKTTPKTLERQQATKVYIGIPFVKTINLPF